MGHAEGEKRAAWDATSDFLDTPMYRLVDRRRSVLETIRTRKDAEYWGHMLIGDHCPDIPNSRGPPGKLAARIARMGSPPHAPPRPVMPGRVQD